MKDHLLQHFVSRTTFVSCPVFNLKEHISVSIAITVIFNQTLTMFMSIANFQKLIIASIWMFNNLLLNKSRGFLP